MFSNSSVLARRDFFFTHMISTNALTLSYYSSIKPSILVLSMMWSALLKPDNVIYFWSKSLLALETVGVQVPFIPKACWMV